MTESNGRHNLTADVTSFVGRTAETTEARSLLGRARLVTLLGPGGVGKTRIARTVGASLTRAFSGGVRLVDFAAVRNDSFVENAVHDVLDGPEGSLSERLGDRRVLLILDNCDPHQCAVGDFVATVLANCPEVRVLATSRSPLNISGEHVLAVAPFQTVGPEEVVVDAVTLFRERVLAAGGGDYTDVPDRDIARLCGLLDGLPLAIELAALHTRTMTIEEIEERLANRFELLHGGPRDVHPRHRSLRTLLEWTWDQCKPDARSMWAQLSSCAGPVSSAEVRAVCRLSLDSDFDATIDELVQQSVLLLSVKGGVPRFDMLNTFREFGSAELTDAGTELRGAPSLADVQRRHLAHALDTAHAAERSWFGPDQAQISATIDSDLSGLRVAFDRALQSDCVAATDLFASLWFRWVGCGHLGEGLGWLHRLLPVLAAQPDRKVRPDVWWVAGWVCVITGHLDAAESHLRRGLDESARAGADRSAGWTMALFGPLRYLRGDFEAGIAVYRDAVEDARARGDDMSTAVFLYQLGEMYCVQGHLDDADVCTAAALEISRRHGDRWCTAYAHWVRALTAFLRGNDEDARSLAAEALVAMADVDDRLGMVLVAELGAWVAARNGRAHDAAVAFGATEAYWVSPGSSMMGLLQLQSMHAAGVATARKYLTDAQYARAAQEGAALGMADAAGRAVVGSAEHHRARSNDGSLAAGRASGATKLTPREIEVAGLVAKGLTNREIAMRFVIGQRTVDTHVANVLTKLGVRRRTEIATQWVRGTPADISADQSEMK